MDEATPGDATQRERVAEGFEAESDAASDRASERTSDGASDGAPERSSSDAASRPPNEGAAAPSRHGEADADRGRPDDDVRRALDSLIHPPSPGLIDWTRGAPALQPVAGSRSADAGPGGRPASVTGSGREAGPSGPAAAPGGPSAGPAHDPVTGLYRGDAWRWLVDAEAARVARYGGSCTLIQLAVVGLGDIATRLGETTARRVMRILVEAVRGSARAIDAFTASGWRLAGLLPETDAGDAAILAGRIRDAFLRAVGAIPLELAVGAAVLVPGEGVETVLAAAEHAMFTEARALLQASERVRRARATGDLASVRGSLAELDRLRAEGLVDEGEHAATRLEILRRV